MLRDHAKFATHWVALGLSVGLGLALVPTAGLASTIVVTPTSMSNWAFDNRDGSGAITSPPAPVTGSLVTGPSTPPLGSGSANLTTPSGAGDTGSEIRNTGYVGTALSMIDALSYSTYATAWNGQQLPYFELYLSTGGRAIFEPAYSPAQGAVALNTWQTWDTLAGGWYDTNGNGGPGANVISWSAIVAANPGATIVNSGDGLGGVRFSIGFASAANNFNAYLDNFTIGITDGPTTTYDFEATSPVPLPAALPLLISGLGGMGLLGWRRKRKPATPLMA